MSTLPAYEPVPLRDQIACVRRELAIRQNVYRRQVERDSAHPAFVAAELQKMQSVLRTLEAIANERGPEWIPPAGVTA
jgi:hypothetical protein